MNTLQDFNIYLGFYYAGNKLFVLKLNSQQILIGSWGAIRIDSAPPTGTL